MVTTQSRRWQPARTGAQAQPDFRLNFLPVTVSDETFAAGILPFESREQLLSLRAEHADSHLFVRRGDTIVDVPLVDGTSTIGEEHASRARDDAGIVRRLLDAALLRFLSGRGYLFTDLHPPTFVARARSRDLVAQAIAGTDAALIEWLHVYPEYRLSARTIHAHSGPPTTGVQVGFWTHREIDATVAQLLERGLDVFGRYVRSLDPDVPVPDGRRDPKAVPRLAGRVRAVVDGWLSLDDARGADRVRADAAWLESRIENFDACLRTSGVTDVAGTIQRLKRLSFERMTGAKARLERLEEIAALLR